MLLLCAFMVSYSCVLHRTKVLNHHSPGSFVHRRQHDVPPGPFERRREDSQGLERRGQNESTRLAGFQHDVGADRGVFPHPIHAHPLRLAAPLPSVAFRLALVELDPGVTALGCGPGFVRVKLSDLIGPEPRPRQRMPPPLNSGRSATGR